MTICTGERERESHPALAELIINIQTGGYFGFYCGSDEVEMLLNMTILTNITVESHSQIFLQEKILNDPPGVETLQGLILVFIRPRL